jgi:hypothetical protein
MLVYELMAVLNLKMPLISFVMRTAYYIKWELLEDINRCLMLKG